MIIEKKNEHSTYRRPSQQLHFQRAQPTEEHCRSPSKNQTTGTRTFHPKTNWMIELPSEWLDAELSLVTSLFNT